MAEIKVTGSSKADVAHALGLTPYILDIQLGFRSTDFGKTKLPGLQIKVRKDEFQSREFTNLTDAIAYIRKLYRDHHGGQ